VWVGNCAESMVKGQRDGLCGTRSGVTEQAKTKANPGESHVYPALLQQLTFFC